ncbi:hypothetical protein MJC1_00289 [Methylocystis sp. MJC1]|jgi:hypothetical protein|nr:hypothetical protein MJC1_00289 [Methylocystis sp. MJC1]
MRSSASVAASCQHSDECTLNSARDRSSPALKWAGGRRLVFACVHDAPISACPNPRHAFEASQRLGPVAAPWTIVVTLSRGRKRKAKRRCCDHAQNDDACSFHRCRLRSALIHETPYSGLITYVGRAADPFASSARPRKGRCRCYAHSKSLACPQISWRLGKPRAQRSYSRAVRQEPPSERAWAYGFPLAWSHASDRTPRILPLMRNAL